MEHLVQCVCLSLLSYNYKQVDIQSEGRGLFFSSVLNLSMIIVSGPKSQQRVRLKHRGEIDNTMQLITQNKCFHFPFSLFFDH